MTARDIAKAFEGFHRVVTRQPVITAVPYLCPANYWTVAYGHLCREDHPPVTKPQGEAFLDRDLGNALAAVAALCPRRLTPGQLDALTDWTFNLGAGRLRGSTLRAVVNRGEFDRVPSELRRWVYGGGKKLPGLVRRREAEVALWNS